MLVWLPAEAERNDGSGEGAKGGHHVLDADIRDCFGSIDRENYRDSENPPVSRVSEIGTQGLKGGLALAPALRREGK
jgi:hypothetical protein